MMLLALNRVLPAWFLQLMVHLEARKHGLVRLDIDGNLQFGPFKEPLRYFTPEDPRARATSSEVIHNKRSKTTETPRSKVSDIHGVRKFIVLIYKKNMDIFDDIKRKIHPPLRTHVDMIKQQYTDKFIEFVNTTQHHSVKTKSGSQKVIMNTINISDNIVRRLIGSLVNYMNNRGVLRSTVEDTEKLFEGELDKEKVRHFRSACDKLNICKTNQAFSNFNVDFFGRLVRTDDYKVKQAMDSLIETLKESHIHDIIPNRDKLNKILESAEKSSADAMRTRFFLYKNVINNRYRPLTLYKDSDKKMVKRTLSFTDFVEAMDRVTDANKNSTSEFNNVLLRVGQWANDFTGDIQNTMRAYVKIITTAIRLADYDTKNNIRQYLRKMIS